MALKLAPNKDEAAKALLEQYGVRGYPTMVFADAEGAELDRLTGFMPPAELISEIERIQSGDTFVACLEKLDENPGDPGLLDRAVRGLLDRGDIKAAYARLAAFDDVGADGLENDPSALLLARTMAEEHSSLYRKVGLQFRGEWPEVVDVSESRSTPALAEALAEGLTELDREEQAERLRAARHQDALPVLHLVMGDITADDAFDAARFAVSNGHYEAAAGLYSMWHEQAGASKSSGALNAAAWDLYLAREDLELAVEMAREAYAEDSSPDVADTLARLLYVTDNVDDAIRIQSEAAAESEGDTAEAYSEVVEIMKAGGELEDRSYFDSYPE